MTNGWDWLYFLYVRYSSNTVFGETKLVNFTGKNCKKSEYTDCILVPTGVLIKDTKNIQQDQIQDSDADNISNRQYFVKPKKQPIHKIDVITILRRRLNRKLNVIFSRLVNQRYLTSIIVSVFMPNLLFCAYAVAMRYTEFSI